MNRILQDYRYYLRMERSLSPNTVAAERHSRIPIR